MGKISDWIDFFQDDYEAGGPATWIAGVAILVIIGVTLAVIGFIL